MKKKFKLDELDCAVCGAKMEDAIRKIPGVNDVQVNFLLQKLTLDADDLAGIEHEFPAPRHAVPLEIN